MADGGWAVTLPSVNKLDLTKTWILSCKARTCRGCEKFLALEVSAKTKAPQSAGKRLFRLIRY